MIKNYLKIAWRNFHRNKLSSLLNVGGLTVGIAIALLMGLWIFDELSFNKYHQNYDRIARVVVKGNDAKEGPFVNNSLPYPLAAEMRTNYKQNFANVVRSSWDQSYILSAGEKKLSRFGKFMDAEAPQMFTLKMLRGSWNGLTDPHSIFLSSSTAKDLFGSTDPMNQMVSINNKMTVKVTGIYEDLPANTDLTSVKFFSTWDLWVAENEWIGKRATNDWMNHFLRLYVEIKPGTTFDVAGSAVADLEMHKLKTIEKYKEHVARNPKVELIPMSNWHLRPIDRNAQIDANPLKMVWFVGSIGMFILVLACINFMNLSTARSEKRAKEVGIRKTMGSMRSQLIKQFFGESLLTVAISFCIALVIVMISLPWFNQLANKPMIIPSAKPGFWLICFSFILFLGLVAGSYPALYLSSFKTISALKGKFQVGRFAALPRKVLVVLQFTISEALIICTAVIYRQVQTAKDRPVGYDRNGLLMIEMKSNDYNGKYQVFRNEFLNTGVVKEVSQSMGMVTEVVSGNNGFDWKSNDPADDESFGTLAVTAEHGRTVGWQFVSGRDFSPVNISDSGGVVINEAAARQMKMDHPVGETLTWKWRENPPKPYMIVGVIKDAIMESPYEDVEPTMFFLKALNGGVSCINIRIKPGVVLSDALPEIERAFKAVVPTVPFEYKFADEQYALKFSKEENIASLAGFFGMFAIFISCLGLFGLAAFVAERRSKEMNVRKILGASVFQIWHQLSKEFLALVGISFSLAAPLAYYFMHDWLQDYQFRTALSWWIFFGAGGLALAIAVLTVSAQTFKAAVTNPAIALRNE